MEVLNCRGRSRLQYGRQIMEDVQCTSNSQPKNIAHLNTTFKKIYQYKYLIINHTTYVLYLYRILVSYTDVISILYLSTSHR